MMADRLVPGEDPRCHETAERFLDDAAPESIGNLAIKASTG